MMMMMGVLTHGLIVIQRHPVEQYTALLHVQILKIPPNYKRNNSTKKKTLLCYIKKKQSLRSPVTF